MDKCIRPSGHCVEYDQETMECSKCGVGWGLDDKNECVSCPSNSISCDKQESTNKPEIVCEDKRYFDTATYQCLPCHGSCQQCAVDTGVCEICSNTMYVIDSKDKTSCVACRQKYGNLCLECSEGINGVCTACIFGNILKENVSKHLKISNLNQGVCEPVAISRTEKNIKIAVYVSLAISSILVASLGYFYIRIPKIKSGQKFIQPVKRWI